MEKGRIGFMCVRNAGRSQMAMSFAEEECKIRNDIKTRVQKLFDSIEETGIHGRTGC